MEHGVATRDNSFPHFIVWGLYAPSNAHQTEIEELSMMPSITPKTKLKTNAEWRMWGKEDPLWGVSSWKDRQIGGAQPWTEEEFYALGHEDWQEYQYHWQQYGFNPESCLEVGCGAGRITRQLTTIFKQVYAVDVSEAMISRARASVDATVQFFLTDGLELPLEDQTVKAVFSTFVLQHLDNEAIGLLYFREIYRVLDREGTLMIQLPLYSFPAKNGWMRTLMQTLHTASRSLGEFLADIRRGAGLKLMRVTPYSIETLNSSLLEAGFKDIQFKWFSMKSNGDRISFVFATKSDSH